jgi:hypothetical protein
MSWDLFVANFPTSAKSLADLPQNHALPPLDQRSEIIERIRAALPNSSFQDAEWGTFAGADFHVEFNMGKSERIDQFALHIHGDYEKAAPAITVLLKALNFRAANPTALMNFFRSELKQHGPQSGADPACPRSGRSVFL